MREILFRGKRVDDGEWIYGHYVHQYGSDMIYLPDGVDHEYGFDYYHIDTETVGQFTGLQDDNGKRIFEGDIVDGLILHNLPIRAVVSFQDGAFGLDWQRGEVRVFTAFTSYCNTVFKVIGNIHDTPDLLKGE